MKHYRSMFLDIGLFVSLALNVFAQETVITPDLTKIISGDSWRVVNREPEIVTVNGQTCVHFKAHNRQGGIAWLENFEFTNGVIEVDIKGFTTDWKYCYCG